MVALDWNKIENDYDSIIKKLLDSGLDKRDRAQLQRKSFQYSNLLSTYKEIVTLQDSVSDLKKQIEEEKDEQMHSLFEEEISDVQLNLEKLNIELEDQLYPSDESEERSVFVEIRAGVGGQEAALFVADLFKMYSNYALTKNWTTSIVDMNLTDIGGYKELIAYVKGKNVYKHLKFEQGVHRVQRVPETETSGRIHTSTVTVAVLPEAEEVDFEVNPQDLRIDVFRASGAGGQHVNTTDSAVRITHIPTGVVVSCQDERSQIKNKARAMKVLRSRLLQAEKERHAAQMSAERKKQIGMGERAEKIRTYNYPQNRVTDHRTNLTLKKLDIIMQGQLDDLIEPLLRWYASQQRHKASAFSEYFSNS